MSYPPTIIVVHPRENRKKCSVEALRAHPDFRFWTFPDKVPDDLSRYVRLGIGGLVISAADAESGLLVLDGTWRLAERMERTFAALPVRSLPPVRTAYPRMSKIHDDPSEGLATIEAIYAAYRLLGRETSHLLDGYHWRERFLELNPELA